MPRMVEHEEGGVTITLPRVLPWASIGAVLVAAAAIVVQGTRVAAAISGLEQSMSVLTLTVARLDEDVESNDDRLIVLETMLGETSPADVREEVRRLHDYLAEKLE